MRFGCLVEAFEGGSIGLVRVRSGQVRSGCVGWGCGWDSTRTCFSSIMIKKHIFFFGL